MSLFEDHGCGCGEPQHPEVAPLPAGLTTLPARQRAGFPDYREAMLHAIPAYPELDGWRARGAGDLGVMLLEGWAYVLDVTGFYDARNAERAYIQTAPNAISAQRIVGLIGYHPRGAVAASVRIAVDVDGADPLLVPKGTGFRSEAFGKEPPQVFEADNDSWTWPQRNRWQLAPIPGPTFDGVLRFMARTAPPKGAVILVTSGKKRAAARIARVEPETGQDGTRYQRLVLAEGAEAVAALAGRSMATMTVAILRLPLAGNGFTTAYVPRTRRLWLTLDSLYPQVLAGTYAAVEIGGIMTPVKILRVGSVAVTVNATTGAVMTATRVVLKTKPAWSAGQNIVLHAVGVPVGPPVAPALTRITLADIAANGGLVAPVKPLDAAPASGTVLARGAARQGVALDGTVIEFGNGGARFQPGQANTPFADALKTPVELLGNVIIAIRGETVVDEVLGSGDAGKPFNRFALARKPLAWREDASQAGGRKPDLAVRVNAVEWTRVDSFFGKAATAEIYVVRTLPDGNSEIRFGDGVRGARPATGVDNVRATYRYGAGAATPPPDSIHQSVRAPRTLAAVRGPVAAVGGADADSPDDLRTLAPASALTIGRAVSIGDFVALARSYPGIVNAAAGWAWDVRGQRAVVKIWVVASGSDPSSSLATWLAGQAATDQPVTVVLAGTAPFKALSIDLAIAARFDRDTVVTAAKAALFDPATGLFAPARQDIGAPLFRSAVTARLHAVPGLAGVTSILIDGVPMPVGVAPGEGCWFDLAAASVVK